MKRIQLLWLFPLGLSLLMFLSCGSGGCENDCLNNGECVEGICKCPDGYIGPDCGTYCYGEIFGVWDVTNIQPIGCTLLTYEFGTSSFSSSILSITIDDGTKKLTGTGLIEADCSAMTYSVSGIGFIESGSITFEGNTLTDMSSLGCLISATKQ